MAATSIAIELDGQLRSARLALADLLILRAERSGARQVLLGLLELEPDTSAFGYVILQLASHDPSAALEALAQRGWLYLHDGRGQGPWPPERLPQSLLSLDDDPYRSLVWKLKQEKVISPAPLIPFHEFRWGAWLRSRCLPPFSSLCLEPALPAARALARSAAPSRLAGWRG